MSDEADRSKIRLPVVAGPQSFFVKVQYKKISSLKPNPRNSRSHPRAQRRKLRASIRRFRFINPVIVDDGGMILVGHERIEAAREEGYEEVPVIQVEHLTEVEKKAYALADNKLAELAGWDMEILSLELESLLSMEMDIELTGFSTAEVDLILNEIDDIDSREQVDPPALDRAAITRLGDRWLMENHALLCGDARDRAAYENLLGGALARLTITDPPYNVKIDGNVSGLGSNKHREFAFASGEMSEAEFSEFLIQCFRPIADFSCNGAIAFVFMDWRHVAEALAAGRITFQELKNLIVWVKTNAGMGTCYRSQHELILMFKNGTAAHVNNFELGQHGRYRTNVWQYRGANAFGPDRLEELVMHPTVKPVALIADAIKDCSNIRDLILDPFAGSGTTIIAAEVTNRRARAIEIDPHYCDVAIRRWQKLTGKFAVHAVTKARFDDLEEKQ